MASGGASAFTPTLPEIYNQIKSDLMIEIDSIRVSPDGNELQMQWPHMEDQSDCNITITHTPGKHIKILFTQNLVKDLIVEQDDTAITFRIAYKHATSHTMSARVLKADDNGMMTAFIRSSSKLPEVEKTPADIALDMIYIALLGNALSATVDSQ
jgi:hypothetical protein